jgi:hypothetical protein
LKVETCVTNWQAGPRVTGVEKLMMQGNAGQQVQPTESGIECIVPVFSMPCSRAVCENPSYHLRTTLALKLGPELLDEFGDCGFITSRHFSRAVERLARWVGRATGRKDLLSMIRSSATPI